MNFRGDDLSKTYRPDIDGLRAVAVLSVVGYHAFPNWIPGGFVGVDIFFVISGYLITTILLSNLAADRFSIANFYGRRIKRIFPALILVLIFSAVVGWFSLFAFEYEALGTQIAATSAFVSNFLLWSEAGYFAKAAETKPLLHLWSLAIEEQFYIFWPIFLLVVWRIRLNVIWTFVAALAASFAFNIHTLHSDPVADFYSPLARFWELLAGAILAELTLNTPAWFAIAEGRFNVAISHRCRINMRVSDLKAPVGLALIVVAVFALNQNSHFPGYFALLPVIGACLIISARQKSWSNDVLLSGRAMVWIGLISYPLYLWHWPLLSFARIISGKVPSPGIALLLVLASIVFATMTFLFIERPIRLSSLTPAKIVAVISALGAIGGAGYYTSANAGFPSRQKEAEKIIEATKDWRPPELNAVYHGVPAWSAGAGDKDVLFIGDSEMQQYFPRLKYLSERMTGRDVRRLVMLTRTGCAPYPGIFRQIDPADGTGFGCGDFLREVLPLTKVANVATIVFAGAWYSPLRDPNFYVKLDGVDRQLVGSEDARNQVFSNFGKLIHDLVVAGKRVFIVNDIPPAASPLEMLPVGWARLSGRPAIPAMRSRRSIEEQMGPVDNRVEKIAVESGATVINPIDFLCNDKVCPTVTDDGRPRYMDAYHLRGSFVRDSVRYLDGIVD
jgi:peptidoglycan/LPS O-acetylase OafA/YrhL